MMPYYELADEEDITDSRRMEQIFNRDNNTYDEDPEYQRLNRRFKEKNGYDYHPGDTFVDNTRFYQK